MTAACRCAKHPLHITFERIQLGLLLRRQYAIIFAQYRARRAVPPSASALSQGASGASGRVPRSGRSLAV